MTRWYGSLQNRLMEGCVGQPAPEVGMGVTECMWSDREPYEIVAVDDDRHITIRRLDYKRVDDNGMSECQDYEYFSNPDNMAIRLFKDKNGRWVRRVGRNGVDRSSGWVIGFAERYFDFSF